MSPKKNLSEDERIAAEQDRIRKARAERARLQEKRDKKREKEASKLAKKKKKTPILTFTWEALDETGQKVGGTEKAVSAGAVNIQLLQKGFQPLEVKVKKSALNFEITKKTVPREEVMNFSRQLAVFMHAGIPIMESLEVIIEETQGKMLKSVLIDVVDKLRNGETFATAAKTHPEAFPNYYVGILESAELTGNLDTVLNQLAEYIDRDVKARSKVTSALIYPAVVAAMSVVTVVILTVFVLPRFEVFFASLNAKLPLVTRMMLGFSSFVGHWWYVILAVILILVGSFTTMQRTERGRAQIDTWKLRLPVIGDITQTSILERTCRILSSLLRAGVDLPRSMEVTAESANNVVYRKAIEGIRDDMMQGQGLAAPLARTGLFPGAARQMFRVGEETGTLDEQLEVAAAYYGRELETKVDRATTLFEPAIIIFMGGVVGFVAVALISAMYGIYNQVQVH